MSMGIHDILRASDVQRWTIVRTVKKQTVAEHTFNVVMLARRIANILEIPDEEIIKCALEHDLDEIMTGDMPAPVKKQMREKGFMPEELENRQERPELAKTIVKAADFIESTWFLHENAVGRHADQVLEWLSSRKLVYVSRLSPGVISAIRQTERELLNGKFTI